MVTFRSRECRVESPNVAESRVKTCGGSAMLGISCHEISFPLEHPVCLSLCAMAAWQGAPDAPMMVTPTFEKCPWCQLSVLRMCLGGWADAEISVSLFPAAGAAEAVAVLTHPFSTLPTCQQQVPSPTQP